MDVRGFEPLTPCLQSRLGKILTAFAGAAYTKSHRNSRPLIVPNFYRSVESEVSRLEPENPSVNSRALYH